MNSIIRWLAEHPLAVNLTAILLVSLGVLTALQLPQKTFPEFTLDVVSISVAYPGASAAEIQESIVRPIEDQLSGIEGIDSVTATISEGRGGIAVSFSPVATARKSSTRSRRLSSGSRCFPRTPATR